MLWWFVRVTLTVIVLTLGLETLVTAVMQHLNLAPPAEVRREHCATCKAIMLQVDKTILLAAEEKRGVALDGDARVAFTNDLMNAVCSTSDLSAKACLRWRDKIDEYVVRHERFFAAVAKPPDGATPLPQLGASGLCPASCIWSIRELIQPYVALTPAQRVALKPTLVIIGELWGTILVVSIVFVLLVLALRARAAAAQRQHELYVALLRQFRARGGVDGNGQGGDAPKGGKGAGRPKRGAVT